MILAKVIFDDKVLMLELFPNREFRSMIELWYDMRHLSDKFQEDVAYTLVEHKPTLTLCTREQTKIEKGEL